MPRVMVKRDWHGKGNMVGNCAMVQRRADCAYYSICLQIFGNGKVSMIKRPPVALDPMPVNTVFPLAVMDNVCFVNMASQS